MDLKAWIALSFKFAAIPVSVLILIVYGAVFTAVLVTDQTPDIPNNKRGLSLQKAYEDLHVVSSSALCMSGMLKFHTRSQPVRIPITLMQTTMFARSSWAGSSP